MILKILSLTNLHKMSIEAILLQKWSDDFTWDAAAEHFIKTVREKFPQLINN